MRKKGLRGSFAIRYGSVSGTTMADRLDDGTAVPTKVRAPPDGVPETGFPKQQRFRCPCALLMQPHMAQRHNKTYAKNSAADVEVWPKVIVEYVCSSMRGMRI